MSRNMLFAFFCLFASGSASGAPFCVEAQGLPSECWYYDIRLCKQEAAKRDAHCTANNQEISAGRQGAAYCIVDTGMVPVCSFEIAEACHMAAANQNAVCFKNSGSADFDPYRLSRPAFQYGD
jgi:hypothetical protein